MRRRAEDIIAKSTARRLPSMSIRSLIGRRSILVVFHSANCAKMLSRFVAKSWWSRETLLRRCFAESIAWGEMREIDGMLWHVSEAVSGERSLDSQVAILFELGPDFVVDGLVPANQHGRDLQDDGSRCKFAELALRGRCRMRRPSLRRHSNAEKVGDREETLERLFFGGGVEGHRVDFGPESAHCGAGGLGRLEIADGCLDQEEKVPQVEERDERSIDSVDDALGQLRCGL